MSVRGCGLGRGAREIRRRHYCGTCKVIGREYGQASRLFLNHDTVLVAEIITALTGAPDWGAAIESRNCFHLPKTAADAPPVLRYAAAATVLLASAKVQDHASDSGKLRWRALGHWLNPRYRSASAELRKWGVRVAEIERQLATQQRREALHESLESLAEPTCFATSEICSHAAEAAGRPEHAPPLESFGRRFGYLVYLLDAWEDYDQDVARGDFNAFQTLYGNRGFGRVHLEAAAQAVACSFRELPVGAGFRNELQVRFRSNFAARLHGRALFGEGPLPVAGQLLFGTAGLALAGVPIAMAPIAPNKRPSGGFMASLRGTCCGGCDDSCCDGCCDGCCSSCDCS